MPEHHERAPRAFPRAARRSLRDLCRKALARGDLPAPARVRADARLSELYYLLVDRAEDRPAFGVEHLDAHTVAELEVWGLRLAVLDGFDRAFLRQAAATGRALPIGDR